MYLAIDYGEKRIGLALGKKIPRALGVIENKSQSEILDKIENICQEEKIEKIILGLPDQIDSGSESLISQIKNIGQALESKLKLKVIFEPEAYSSVAAEDWLKSKKHYSRKNKGQIDQLAAVLLLEQYINRVES